MCTRGQADEEDAVQRPIARKNKETFASCMICLSYFVLQHGVLLTNCLRSISAVTTLKFKRLKYRPHYYPKP